MKLIVLACGERYRLLRWIKIKRCNDDIIIFTEGYSYNGRVVKMNKKIR